MDIYEPRWSPVLGSRGTKHNTLLERKAAFEGSNKWLSFLTELQIVSSVGQKHLKTQSFSRLLFSCYTEKKYL